jgi:hypothetical protein
MLARHTDFRTKAEACPATDGAFRSAPRQARLSNGQSTFKANPIVVANGTSTARHKFL